MGNLCGSPSAHDGGETAPGETGRGTAANVAKAKPAASSSACEARSEPIEQAMENAKKELVKNAGKKFADHYALSKLIGHGAFAKVSMCTHNATKESYAVKAVSKMTADPHKQREGIIKEIAIMRMLQDHPNTVVLKEVFEDDDLYQLVMELCSGGELFDQIIAKGHYSEKHAAEKMQSLMSLIAYAHSKDIIHRDLKPENILLSDKTPTALLKVIDFGTSDFCKDGERLQQKFGTPYYVAPEVLKNDYDKLADIWSAGVIMYILLCGFPPFAGKTDVRILQRVQAGAYNFDGREWEIVTEAAKNMISQMLVLDISKRASAKSLLQHRWFQVAATAPAAALGQHMVKRLRAFAGMSRMKRLALVVLARTLTDHDVKRLRELFSAMDTNCDGCIDSADLHNALAKVGAAIDELEMQDLFHASVIDGHGKIDYEEFIAAMLDSSRCRKSFQELDNDGDGFITAEDLVKVMPRGSSIELAREIVNEVDQGKNGKMDYDDFKAMMQS
eukprot:gene18948-25518_t